MVWPANNKKKCIIPPRSHTHTHTSRHIPEKRTIHFILFHFVSFYAHADTKANPKRSWPLQYSSWYLWFFFPFHYFHWMCLQCNAFFSSCDSMIFFFRAIHSPFLISPYIFASLKELKQQRSALQFWMHLLLQSVDAVWIPVKFATWKCWIICARSSYTHYL